MEQCGKVHAARARILRAFRPTFAQTLVARSGQDPTSGADRGAALVSDPRLQLAEGPSCL